MLIRTSFWYECECVGVAYGSRCEWGEECQQHNSSATCSGHGECRYYRGSVTCTCDEEHFGLNCEHHISSGQPLLPSACHDKGLECSHLCSLESHPHCLCPPHLVLHNTTHCIPRDQLVDVTVQVLDNHHYHFPLDQAKNVLKEACITVFNASYHNDSKEFHFTMNKYWRNCLPEKSQWETVLNSSVNLPSPQQQFLWIGPFNKSVDNGRLVLQSTVFTSLLPMSVSFFIGHHQIYTHEVNLCQGYYHNEVRSLALELINDTTITVDNACSSNTICSNTTLCTITLWAEGYDPELDWGTFSIEVSTQGNTITQQQSVVVDPEPMMMVAVQPLSAAMYKDGNTTLTCTLAGEWKWYEDYEFHWVYPSESGIFEVVTPAWNVSYLYIKYIKETITVSCEVSIWQFCDDRESRRKIPCVGKKCKPKVVTIHCLDEERLRCPPQNHTVPWHSTPVNYWSYSTCPEGFEGNSERQCNLSQNQTAVWSKPIFYNCVYRPFNDMLQRAVLRYLKRGYHITVDYNQTLDEMRQVFERRKSMLLLGEFPFIRNQLNYLLKPSIDSIVFLRFIEEIRNKMEIIDRLQLLPLVRNYLSKETRPTVDIAVKDLLLWKHNIPAEWEYLESHHDRRLQLNVTQPQKDSEGIQGVGTFVFLDPKSIPKGIIYNTKSSKNEVFGHELCGPVMEVLVPWTSELSRFNKNITVNMSYYDPNGTTNRYKYHPNGTTNRIVCGGARVSGRIGEIIEWDLNRCKVLSQNHTDRETMRCQCQGEGLFAFIRVTETNDESDFNIANGLAVSICVITSVLVLILILICIRLSASHKDKRRKSYVAFRLMNRVNTNHIEQTYIPDRSHEIIYQNTRSIYQAESIYQDPHISFSTRNRYLDMTNSLQIAANVWSYIQQSDNIHSSYVTEAQHSLDSNLLEGDYVGPNSIPYPNVIVHHSEQEEGRI